ncbi:MAG: hypothetical protein H6Q03_1349 [Acidobacteria bacterium]|nr:hypothetical protein [Acidobacteriota bacterium]
MPQPATLLRLLACALALAALAERRGLAADGDLDPDFDGDGVYRYSDPASFSMTESVLAPDGAAVVSGALPVTGAPALHWRRITDSQASPLCTYLPPGASSVRPAGATFDSLGRLVLLAGVQFGPGTEHSLLVARFLYPACALDGELDGDGVALHAPELAGYDGRFAGGVATAAWQVFPTIFTRRILIAYSARSGGSPVPDTFLLRLRDDGTLDTGFGGGDGLLLLAAERVPLELTPALDGSFLLLAVTDDAAFDADASVLRFDRDGALDAGFGSAGEARLDLSPSGSSTDAFSAIAVAPDGRIALGGRTDLDAATDWQGAVALLQANGQPDPGFSADGWRTFTVAGAQTTRARSVVVQGDGKLLVAGSHTDPADDGDDEGLVARFSRSGALDATFGSSGIRSLAFDHVPAGEDLATGVSVRPDGRIWVAGSTAVDDGFGDQHYRPYVARLVNSYVFADGFERGSRANW